MFIELDLILEVFTWTIRIIMIPIVIARPSKPAIALVWLLLVIFAPWVALFAYLLVGETRLGGRRARRYARDVRHAAGAKRPPYHGSYVLSPPVEGPQRPLVAVATEFVGLPILGGNDVELIPTASNFIAGLIADIDSAQFHVHMVYFIIEDDEVGKSIADALLRARKRGVECRLLADAAGSFGFHRRIADSLIEQGVQVEANLSVSPLRRAFARFDLRNHRKLAVIDGRIAYAGSHNIIRGDAGNRRAGVWKDVTARIKGPSVGQLQAVFYEDWHFQTGEDLVGDQLFPDTGAVGKVPMQVVPSGPHFATAVMRDIAIEALHAARRRVVITTPYLIPDEPLLTALRLASARGACVDIVMPLKSDNLVVDLAGRAYFRTILESGCRIWLNRGGMLHAKTMTIDEQFAMIGSANFDIRSFFLNFELNLLLYGDSSTERLLAIQEGYIREAEGIQLDAWGNNPPYKRMAHRIAMLFSPLL